MLMTIYGKREGYGTSYYKDKSCTQFLAHNPYHKHYRNKVVMLNGAKYYLVCCGC